MNKGNSLLKKKYPNGYMLPADTGRTYGYSLFVGRLFSSYLEKGGRTYQVKKDLGVIT